MVSEDARIEPRTFATSALAVRCSNHSARSHPWDLAECGWDLAELWMRSSLNWRSEWKQEHKLRPALRVKIPVRGPQDVQVTGCLTFQAYLRIQVSCFSPHVVIQYSKEAFQNFPPLFFFRAWIRKAFELVKNHTTMEGAVRIQYKCLVPIYVFPEMKLRAALLFPKQNCNIMCPNFHIHVSVSNLYIPRIGLPILLQPNRQTNHGNI